VNPLVPFYICGGLLVAWALLLSFLGVTRENFPSSGGEKVVGALTVVFVVAAIGTAVAGAIAEQNEEEHGDKEAGAVPALRI
jgi:fructose-specific phosphotransferase system IIC component